MLVDIADEESFIINNNYHSGFTLQTICHGYLIEVLVLQY